jgi:general secretion pathway protein F
MPVYEYTALDVNGKTTTGIIDAESAPAARQKLRLGKSFPVTIQEVLEASEKKETESIQAFPFVSRIKPSDIAMMTRQLATLVGAGFPLVSGIDAMIPQTKSKPFKKMLARIKDAIVEGNSFAAALSLYPSTFSTLYTNMVKAGETSGTLEIVLDQLADITEKQEALKNRIRTAMAYPILMSFIGIAVLFFLVTFIVPNITGIFEEMNQTLPVPTRLLISVSAFFKSYWWMILLAMVGLFLLLRSIQKTSGGRFFIDKTLLKLPIFGVIFRKLAIARFARTLGSLLENGVSMLTSLEIVKNIAGNVLILKAVENAIQEVSKGIGLGASLSAAKAFPDLSIQMIQVGEQSGDLEKMLEKIASVYESEIEASVLSITALLEPVMILIMGVIFGFMVLSICLPIFEMNQLVM